MSTMTEEEKTKRFIASPLGKSWWRYHNAMIDFWGLDKDAPETERIKLMDDLGNALTPFRARLMELANVE